MAFLADIQKFNKRNLQQTETVVTTAGGKQMTEIRVVDGGFHSSEARASTTGFILSDQPANPSDPETSTSRTSIEFHFYNQLSSPSPEELQAHIKWSKERNQLGDGFFASPPNPALRCAVFVLEKSKHEQHYDCFSFILSPKYFVQQIDKQDILSGVLKTLDVVIFPGGLIFNVEKSLGLDGSQLVLEYVAGGGGFFGVCAGAFLASSDGYNGSELGRRLLCVKTGYIGGIGKAKVRFNDRAGEIFGREYGNKEVELFWANGPLFKVLEPKGEKNEVIGQLLGKCEVLGEFRSLTIGDDKEKSLVDYPFNVASLCSEFGKGRVLVFGPHPEASGPSFQSCILSAIDWCKRRN